MHLGARQNGAIKQYRVFISNEKYKGDALLQKSYTVDFLQKKTKKNEGEIPQYYVEGNHEAIIPSETFDLVQTEIQKRYGMVGNTVGLAFSHQGLNAVSAEVGTVQRYGIPRISTEGSSIVAITNSMEIRNAAHRTLWRMK